MNKAQEVSLWAGLAGFFGCLLAIGIFDVFDIQGWEKYLGALIVAGITGGAVYSKERLGYAKERENGGNAPASPPAYRTMPGPREGNLRGLLMKGPRRGAPSLLL